MVDTPFASSFDVEARWRTLTAAESVIAETLAADASDMIRDRWPDVDARVTAGTLRTSSLTRIVAGMVKRAMNVGPADGFQSLTQGAGPYSLGGTLSNPNGNLYLSSADIRLLDGRTGKRAFAVDLATAPAVSYDDGYYRSD